MNQWKIVSQKTILRAELFDVKEIVLKNNKGKKKIHHEAQRAPVVSIFPLTDSYEIYLISQYRRMLDKTTLEAVAGYVRRKETIIAAARRELKEETGIEALQLEAIARIQMAGSVFKSTANLFLAKSLEIGENDLDEDEQISVVKIPLSEAVEKVISGEINHASSVIGILMLDKMRREKKL
jgi:8-oxo-dGTP pyrophosphatase MutT (NUDIX family)